ncbi:MAG TPA: hypothetical protein PKZ58_05755 [Bacillota bacterium]|nr:hypothetical protein [Bacillota bacterium]
MLIEGPLASGKTRRLIQEFVTLVKSGVSVSEILVICSNSYTKKNFTNRLRQELEVLSDFSFSSLPVYTFNGIAYNAILNNWPIIEEILSSSNNGIPVVIPEMTGLETTQYLLKKSVRDVLDRITLLDSMAMSILESKMQTYKDKVISVQNKKSISSYLKSSSISYSGSNYDIKE